MNGETAESWKLAREYWQGGMSMIDVACRAGLSFSGLIKNAKRENWVRKKVVLSSRVAAHDA